MPAPQPEDDKVVVLPNGRRAAKAALTQPDRYKPVPAPLPVDYAPGWIKNLQDIHANVHGFYDHKLEELTKAGMPFVQARDAAIKAADAEAAHKLEAKRAELGINVFNKESLQAGVNKELGLNHPDYADLHTYFEPLYDRPPAQPEAPKKPEEITIEEATKKIKPVEMPPDTLDDPPAAKVKSDKIQRASQAAALAAKKKEGKPTSAGPEASGGGVPADSGGDDWLKGLVDTVSHPKDAVDKRRKKQADEILAGE